MQVIDRGLAIVRWLPLRGGAAHHRIWQARALEMTVAVAIGANPACFPSCAQKLHANERIFDARPGIELPAIARVPGSNHAARGWGDPGHSWIVELLRFPLDQPSTWIFHEQELVQSTP